jgi:hypothetical protein
LERLSCAQDLPAEPVITTVTLAEHAVGRSVAGDGDERATFDSMIAGIFTRS